ncbi:MAG: hypothetical protein V5804_17525 [Mucilaginibacter sp.]|uniref:hypothetical protein n=1 Tax=Mucilaginibacter sp. TaxID=1882438 RepID=UPI0034E53BEE
MMYAEIRKLHLIEEVLKIDNEYTLSALENILKKTSALENDFQSPFAALSGIWSTEEAQEIETAIVENCEQINQDDWK